MKQLTPHQGLHCANCGTPMQGEFCHACGQSMHSVIKPLHGMLDETLDIVLNVDARVLHTLPPLFARPGFLTLEYFAGRRMRYVAPFRLMFVLCLLAFFFSHVAVEHISFADKLKSGLVSSGNPFDHAKTPADVHKILASNLAELDQVRHAGGPALLAAGPELDMAERTLRRQSSDRLTALGAPSTTIAGAAADAGAAPRHTDGKASDWSPTKPVHVAWLPDFANAALSHSVGRIKANVLAMSNAGPQRDAAIEKLLSGFFAVLPQTMFVLIPTFALLLKLVYLFKRRLYMEHLIVALHSHAFLFLALLLGTLVHLLTGWIEPRLPWIAAALGWLAFGLWLWMPTYLLLMQKRIYRQGWPMTAVKYLLVGWCYCWLLGLALIIAGLIGFSSD
jgi:hypothetical protein